MSFELKTLWNCLWALGRYQHSSFSFPTERSKHANTYFSIILHKSSVKNTETLSLELSIRLGFCCCVWNHLQFSVRNLQFIIWITYYCEMLYFRTTESTNWNSGFIFFFESAMGSQSSLNSSSDENNSIRMGKYVIKAFLLSLLC